MVTITHDAEDQLVDLATGFKNAGEGHYALHYHLALLSESYRSEYQIKIGVNILHDLFKGMEAKVFTCSDSDIIVVFGGGDRGLLEKAVFQIRYLFMDDPLAYNDEGFENEDFCTVYDLEYQWKQFFSICKRKAEGKQVTHKESIKDMPKVGKKASPGAAQKGRTKLKLFSPDHLADIASQLASMDISKALRSQPACAAVKGKEIKPLFEETYVNIAHLQQLMNLDVDVFSSRPLFKYLTEILDKRVLFLLRDQTSTYLRIPNSLNLNVKTLLSEDFVGFDNILTPKMKKSVVIEVSVADIFEDINTFHIAREAVQKLGYRVCIDGLDSISFVQIDRNKLGCDLVKLQWNPEMVTNLKTEENQALAAAIKKAKPNRVILTRCDNEDAIEYGYSLGISLFQGRHFDRILNPNATVIN